MADFRASYSTPRYARDGRFLCIFAHSLTGLPRQHSQKFFDDRGKLRAIPKLKEFQSLKGVLREKYKLPQYVRLTARLRYH